jgi:thioredoxin 1
MKKLLDFYADWCMPCKALSPTIETLRVEYEGSGIAIEKVNIDDNAELTTKYSIRSVPTLVFVDGEEEVHRMTGNQPKHIIKKAIEEKLK